jgi:ABC-type Fe3+/spermidine/putrescine transport system ATPase subunit
MQKLTLKKDEKKAKILEFLEKIKMLQYVGSFPNQLSVGQQQRIAFARALLSGADIILLDEPFSGLDFESKFLLYNLLLEVKHQSQKTIVLVTHDFDEAAFFANQFLIINGNKVCEYNSIEDIYFRPCSKYTASLFQFSNLLEAEELGDCKIQTLFGVMRKKCVSCIGDHSGTIVNYCVRPEHLAISDSQHGISARIEQIKFFGSYYILLLRVGSLKQLIFMKLDKLVGLQQFDEIFVRVDGEITMF